MWKYFQKVTKDIVMSWKFNWICISKFLDGEIVMTLSLIKNPKFQNNKLETTNQNNRNN